MPPPPSAYSRGHFTRTTKQSLELRRVYAQSLEADLERMCSIRRRAFEAASGSAVALFASLTPLPAPTPGERLDLLGDVELDMKHFSYGLDSENSEQSSPAENEPLQTSASEPDDPPRSTARAKSKLAICNPLLAKKGSDFATKLAHYMDLIVVAKFKSFVYSRFWCVHDQLLPSELFSAAPMNEYLPWEAFGDIGSNSKRAVDIVGFYMATDSETRGDMIARARMHEPLTEGLCSLGDPKVSSERKSRWGNHGIRVMVFRRLFKHFHDNGSEFDLLTRAHLIKLSLSISIVKISHAKLLNEIKKAESSQVRHQERAQIHATGGDIAHIMKSGGLSSPLTEIISTDEEWPDGWELSMASAPRKIIHGKNALQPGQSLPRWEEEEEEGNSSCSVSPHLDQVKW